MIIYHDKCIDGFTAAWAAHTLTGDKVLLPASHGDEIPYVAGKRVAIVDFSYPRDLLLEMHEQAEELVVLDHHKTAEEDLRGLPFCVFDMNRSGAGLAWDHFSGGRKRPALVDYVEDRDLWRFQLPASRAINARISTVSQSMKNWSALARVLDNDSDRVQFAVEGAAILDHIDSYIEKMKRQARHVYVGGNRVPMVNAPYINTSELVGELAKGEVFAVGWFQRADGKIQYSLRSRGDFDVSAVARSFGGGGHKNAAGFTLSAAEHYRLFM